MVIEVCGLVIEINLLHLDEFKSIHDYKVDKLPNYFINLYEKEFNIDGFVKISETKFYDKYIKDDVVIQHQKNHNGIYFSYIEYNKKNVNIYIKKSSFLDEYLLSQYAINYLIDNYSNAIFFHSSSIKYENMGIIFSAKSGTGKSTQRRLWEKYGNSLVINDDKNIIRIIDDKLYIEPNPWCGKHMKQNNIRQKLDVIVFLYQSKENVLKELNKKDAFRLLLGQIFPPNYNDLKWDLITDKILELPILYYGCNMEYDAFKVLNERIMEYANK